jgi:hypothetical protein
LENSRLVCYAFYMRNAAKTLKRLDLLISTNQTEEAVARLEYLFRRATYESRLIEPEIETCFLQLKENRPLKVV